MTEQKSGSTRIHKVMSDYGVEDYFKYYRKRSEDTEISKIEYSRVLDLIFCGIRDKMTSSFYDYKLPFGLGKVCIRKYKPKVKLDENGEPYIRRAPDWKATKQMWQENPETKEVKQLVYHTNDHSAGYLFTISWRRESPKFNNRLFYMAQINRKLKRDTSKAIQSGTLDFPAQKNN